MGKISDFFRNILGLGGYNKYSTQQSNIETWSYSRFSKDIYELDTVRASIDAIARNVSKMEFNHIRLSSSKQKEVIKNSDIAKVLKKPNKYMSTRDFIYKCATIHYTTNNCFIFPEYDNGKLVGLHPINYQAYKIVELNGNIYIKFQIKYTKEYVIALEDVINLKRFFNTKDFTGESNSALLPSAELINSQNQGIINGIKNSAIIRGILKTVAIVKEEDLVAKKEKFIEDNLSSSNNGGVMVLDGKYDYVPLDSKPYTVDSDSLIASKNKIFDYFGVNENFIQNKFNSEEYDAIYEGLLEPFGVMFGQALTNALFTELEKGYGNEVEVTMNRLKYQSIKNVVSLVGATNQLGIFTPNEYREMFGYPPLEDGDTRLVSLNYVKSNEVIEGEDDEEE